MSDETEPQVRVAKGHPTDDELAAVVAVISAKATQAAAAGQKPRQPSTWAAYWRTVRTPLVPGPGAWRASALPR